MLVTAWNWKLHHCRFMNMLSFLLLILLTISSCTAFTLRHPTITATKTLTAHKYSISRQQQQKQKQQHQQKHSRLLSSVLESIDEKTTTTEDGNNNNNNNNNKPNVVLVAGFESFNRDLYKKVAKETGDVNLQVFADSDIRIGTSTNGEDSGVNPDFEAAIAQADAFIGSLIFDYDDVLAVTELLRKYTDADTSANKPRFIFESATELMEFNQVGTFSMKPSSNANANANANANDQPPKPAGPPPAVKAVLSKFSSGKEEDKLSGYLKLLKVGPQLLKFVPGDKASDLRTWLEAYRYWNQGGKTNVGAMLQVIAQQVQKNKNTAQDKTAAAATPISNNKALPELQVTPDTALLHPLQRNKYFATPSSYLNWRLSYNTKDKAKTQKYKLAPDDAPRVAILLYRKHVITELTYIQDLITMMEQQGVLPVPIFINGVEAHTIVRDWLTSKSESAGVVQGRITRDASYQPSAAIAVDAVVNTIGFPLVGGPAGSMQAGRNLGVAQTLLTNMNVPYFVAGPLLLQTIPQWKQNGVIGLQSVVLYSLPELDGAIDTVVLGGLVGDKIALVPERVRKLTSRITGWVKLRRTPKSKRRIAISLYGFPPNVGAVGTAALLDVPKSLENLLTRLSNEGYDVGNFVNDPDSSGESLVAALAVLSENVVINQGAQLMQNAVDAKIQRAQDGDNTVAATLAKPGGGLGGARVFARDVSRDELEESLGKFMWKRVERSWAESERGPGVSGKGQLVVSGIQVGNVWITVQPLLGVEGDPMRLLFERDFTPHPQYCAAYHWLRKPTQQGGIGADAVIHLGMHGTVEWLPGQPLGNDRESWSDELLGDLPNIYVYAANNPSESILAKRRGYGTLVSYNVPPYGRAGLYLELANLKELISEYRTTDKESSPPEDLQDAIWGLVQKSGIYNDVPLLLDESDKTSTVTSSDLPSGVDSAKFNEWVQNVSIYLNELEERLFSSGLHVLGRSPSDTALKAYLEAYFDDRVSEEDLDEIIQSFQEAKTDNDGSDNLIASFLSWLSGRGDEAEAGSDSGHRQTLKNEAREIASLLRKTTEELDAVMNSLDGGYVPAAPGGDLLRDGPSVLPTGRNIHALDPYRMPSAGAWARGQKAATEIIRQHREANSGAYPETVAVTLWGLDAIKTRGESVAIVLSLVGAYPVREGTGRIVRFDLKPLDELGRPRVDVLASLSGIFRDSFANVVDLLDDMFERTAAADEPIEMNFIKKHALTLKDDGVERPAARLFSNPPGDYGSMVNEVVGTGDWEESESLGETWKGRNNFSYGRNEGGDGSTSGTARPEVLDLLLETTERVVQEIDSVEYGLTDIQEYYANTGALKKAAENRKGIDPATGRKKKVSLSIIEAFGGPEDADVPVRDVEDVLRIEYRSKLLNPKWRDAMLEQGSGGAYEISQRMTAMVGWSATADVDNFVFDQAAERYALDDEVAKKLQQSNPEAFNNVVKRLLEAAGRGMWETDEDTLDKLRELYSEADDLIEQGSSRTSS